MRSSTYSPAPTAVKPFRRTVAPRVVEQHSRRCALSTKRGRGCTCRPSYDARVKRDGRTHRRTFPTLAPAVAWLDTARGAFLQGELLPPLPAPPTVSLRELATSFVQQARRGQALTRSRRRFATSTIAGYEVALRLRVLPFVEPRSGRELGELPVSEIDARMVQGVVDRVAAHEGPARARVAAAAVRSVLWHGYDRGLKEEPPPTVRTPPPPPRRTHTLSDAERRKVRDAAFADDRGRRRSLLGPLVALLDAGGMRISEALGLVWGPDGLELTAEPPRARIVRETTKTDAGARDLLLDAATAALLREHRLACGRPADGTPVFTDEHGRPLDRSGRVRSGLNRIAQAAGVKLSAHVFRHTHATELAATPGISPAAAAARLGHSDGGVLFLRTYAHPGEAEALVTLQALSDHRASQAAAS